MPKELLKQLEDCLSKESNAEVYIDGDYVNYWSKRITNERNKTIQECKQSIPKMMEIIKDEIEKEFNTGNRALVIIETFDGFNEQRPAMNEIISLLSYPNQNK